MCQRFGHSYLNCVHSVWCLKYSGPYSAKYCIKSLEQGPTCWNCGSVHTTNYHDCPNYRHVSGQTVKLALSFTTTDPLTNIAPKALPSFNAFQASHMNYAVAAKGNYHNPNSTTNIIELLFDLLVTITTIYDPKIMLTTTINAFITILAEQWIFKHSSGIWML